MHIFVNKIVYFDGLTAKQRPVSLQIHGETIIVYSDEHQIEKFLISDLKSFGFKNSELHLVSRLEPQKKLVIKDPVAISKLSEIFKSYTYANTGSYWRRLFWLGTGAILSVYLVFHSIDFLSSIIAASLPKSIELKIQQKIVDSFDKHCSYEGEKTLQSMSDLLMQNYNIELDIKVLLVQNPEINAFALPGRVVVVNSGLLNETQNPDELAGVIAHELAHHEKGHILKSFVRATLLTSAWSAAMGDFSGFLVLDPETMLKLVQLKFSRDSETEADQMAIKILESSKFSAIGLRTFLLRLNEHSKNTPEFLSTHPLGERDKSFTNLPENKNPVAIIDAKSWKLLKESCKSKLPRNIRELDLPNKMEQIENQTKPQLSEEK